MADESLDDRVRRRELHPSLSDLVSGQVDLLRPTLREQNVRERLEWAQYAHGGTALFASHEVNWLVAAIDGLRRLLTGEPPLKRDDFGDNVHRVGPGLDAWGLDGFFGRYLRLPHGTLLKFHTCYLPTGPDPYHPVYAWHVPLPDDKQQLRKCLLEIAEHEGIDLTGA